MRRASPRLESTIRSWVSARPAATLSPTLAVEVERLLERSPRLLLSALLLRRLRPALEQLGALRVAGGGELECLGEARLRACHVERERPFAGQREIPARGCRELLRLLAVGRQRAASSSAVR